jgi:glutathione S-transferase
MALFGAPGDMARCHAIAKRLLTFMDPHLQDRTWLAADHATIADIACYSYIAHAPEGGIDLRPYPNVQAWIARVEGLPRFKAMARSSVPA